MFEISKLPQTGPWPTSDPFLFCTHHHDNYPEANDKMGPSASLAGRNIGSDFSNLSGWSMYHGDKIPGFPRHPHRGFETITIVEKGLIDHADSLGNCARYGEGDVQWLTAGDGIQHSEMFPLLKKNKRNPIDFFQIWINLESSNKRVTPNFSMYWKDDIPIVKVNDSNNLKTEIQLIAGQYMKQKAIDPPLKSWARDKSNDVNIWKIKIFEGARFKLPKVNEGVSRSLYFYKGSRLIIDNKDVRNRSLIEIKDSCEFEVSSLGSDAFILLLQGKTINEPIVQYGPFVMNTTSEIKEAFNDFENTGFGDWNWSSQGPVHGRKNKKFSIGHKQITT